MSFKYRFIISFVSLEAFFIILIVTMNFIVIEKTSKESVEQKIDTTTTLMSELIKSPLSVYDLATLDNILENSKSIKNLMYVIISDASDRIVSTNYENQILDLDAVNAINENHFEKVNNRDVAFTFTQITNEDVHIGHMHIAFDITSQLELIRENRKNTYLIILIEILLSCVLAYFIGKKLTSKLLMLTQVATKIGKDIPTDVPHLDTKNEVGILANAMDKMQHDISNRNEELKLFERLFESTQEAIAITNKDGTIRSVNKAFREITGYENIELLGAKTSVLKSGKHNNEFYRLMWQDILNEGSWHGEIINKKKNQEEFISILHINSIKDHEDNISHFVGIWTDITATKKREHIMRLQSKMATMGEMISNIAHQWRQPLSAISMLSSSILVQKELGLDSDEETKASLEKIIDSSQYLSNTIDDFRNFFQQDKKITKLNIKSLIHDDMSILSTALKDSQIELILDIKEDIIIETYQNELLQAILNILNNAKDALQNKTNKRYVFIEAKQQKQNFLLTIRDNAGGINPAIIERIYEPYFTTKHQSLGTGIGLYMTHSIIVDHMHGEIRTKNVEFEYNNEMYKGAQFVISLPLSLA